MAHAQEGTTDVTRTPHYEHPRRSQGIENRLGQLSPTASRLCEWRNRTAAHGQVPVR